MINITWADSAAQILNEETKAFLGKTGRELF